MTVLVISGIVCLIVYIGAGVFAQTPSGRTRSTSA
jgi:hypothetical protein